MISRRRFMQASAGAAALLGLSKKAFAFVQSPSLRLWQNALRGQDAVSLVSEIGVAAPDASRAPVTGVTHYTFDINKFTDTLHPDLGGPTTLWGFKPTNYLLGIAPSGQRHLDGVIVAERNHPIQITFRNNLPATHPIPIDTTVPGDFTAGFNNRIAVHMHGGHVPWISDGGPFDWWLPDGRHGLSFLNNQVLRRGNSAAPNEAEYYYPMDQPARLMWYHDHAFGMDRNTAYAGVASALVIRDTPYESNLMSMGLPDFIEHFGREIPIVFQDKIFCGRDILSRDPHWEGSVASPGDLWYAHTYDTARYGPLGPHTLPLPEPSTVPEFFGDTPLVNGTAYPQATVEARRYRLRILNACNSRFMNLQLYVDDGSPNGITLNGSGKPTNRPALNHAAGDSPNFLMIGTEGGFLPRPAIVPTNAPFGGSLLLAPAERADVIFDFSAHANQKLILYNDAPAPFPGGDPLNDYFPGLNNKNPVNALTPPGSGPNTRVLMRFNVIPASAPADPPLAITPATDLTGGNDSLLANLVTGVPLVSVAQTRQLTLNESFDSYGRLIQKLGTNQRQPDGTFGQGYLECGGDGGERPTRDSVEVWQIANLTGDTHPIHFHLVNVQVISRQPFNAKNYKGTPIFSGASRPPAPFEAGFKETVRMNPGEVTTVIAKFVVPKIQVVGDPPPSPRTGGHEYVWHCHILEHEEHDMMRPLVVT